MQKLSDIYIYSSFIVCIDSVDFITYQVIFATRNHMLQSLAGDVFVESWAIIQKIFDSKMFSFIQNKFGNCSSLVNKIP